MKSIWFETSGIPKRNPLKGDKKAEVAVIGAGMAGVLTAYYLQEQGKNVVVLEADRIGSGQTGGTTAKITSQHNLIYEKLIRTMGREKAGMYAKANQTAVSEYRRLIESRHISCHFEEKPAYLYSMSVTEPLRREAAAAYSLGIPAVFTKRTGLPFSVFGAVRFDGQAQFQPLEFLREISSGLTIYEQTRVKKVEGHLVETDRGTVEAEKIVFACHYPFINVPGFYFARLYQERSYVLALKNAQSVDGMYLGIDPGGYSFRNEGELLLLGGGTHRTGKMKQKNPYLPLRKTAKHLWPDCEETAFWSAQDCMTFDKVPYIGAFSASTPDWYVASGFQKWGMTSSMVAAMILSDMVAGRRNPYEAVFSPQRFWLKGSAGAAASHFWESVKGLAAGAVPGVPRCPHMGCRLKWNAAEKSWDCPCHGSRFRQSGEILDNPAQQSIPFIN